MSDLFEEYLHNTKELIQSRRHDLAQQDPVMQQKILEANIPFDYPNDPSPSNNNKHITVLCIHGLLDSPFTTRDIAAVLQKNGIHVRSILLPGHGTRPDDLFSVQYEQWITTVNYHLQLLESLNHDIYLFGYSTGGLLAIQQALTSTALKGIITIAPPIALHTLANLANQIFQFENTIGCPFPWVIKSEEYDYTRYLSIAFNAVHQVKELIQLVNSYKNETLHCPHFMILTEEDETVSSSGARQFFEAHCQPNDKLLLYSTNPRTSTHPQIQIKNSVYPDKNIESLSHIALPLAPNNPYYGETGDCRNASHPNTPNTRYGAYNQFVTLYDSVKQSIHLAKTIRRGLTYNPDFFNMANDIVKFIEGKR